VPSLFTSQLNQHLFPLHHNRNPENITMAPPTHFTLNTGAQIPAVGLGTWKSEPGEVRKAVAYAIKTGYRHIDAALIYGNENEVGQGIKDSGVPREELWITSKLWNTHQGDVVAGLQKTLDALGTDYLDLYVRSIFGRDGLRVKTYV